MPGNPEKEFQDAIRLIFRHIDTFIRETVIQIDTGLVLRTPVRTGRARSNWQVKVGNPPNSSILTPVSQQSAIDREDSSVYSIPQLAVNRKDKISVYIANNVNYIGDLNKGKSKQAPPGFIEQEVARAVAYAANRFNV